MAYVQPPTAYNYDPAQQQQQQLAPAPYTAPPPAQPQAYAPVAQPHQYPAPVAQPVFPVAQHTPQAPPPTTAPPATSGGFDLDDLLDTGNNGTAAQRAAVPPPPAHAPPPPVNNDPFGFQQQPVAQQQPLSVQPVPVHQPPVQPVPVAQPVAAAYTYQPGAPMQPAVAPPAQLPVQPPIPGPAYTYQPPVEVQQPPPPAPMQPAVPISATPGYPDPAAPYQPGAPMQPGAPQAGLNPYAPQQQQPPVQTINPYAPLAPVQPNPYEQPGQQMPPQAGMAPPMAQPVPAQDQWQRDNAADQARLEQLQRMKEELRSTEEREKDIRAEKDTWPCPSCTYRTALSQGKCQMCDTPRPGYSSSAGVPAPEQRSVQFAQPAPPSNSGGGILKWLCPKCSVSNSDAANICKVCNTSKPDQPTAADPVQRNTSAPASTANEWPCPVCTLANALTNAACSACQNPRPAHIQVPTVQALPVQPAPVRSGGGGGGGGKWTCPTCTFESSKKAPKCQMCETPQPGYVAQAQPVVDAGGYPGGGRQGGRQGGGAGQRRPSPQSQPAPADDQEIKWQDDKFATNCNKCSAQFGLLNRKHHCRNCGFVFCGNCSSNKAKMKPTDREDVRMCLDCFREKSMPSQTPGGGGGGGGRTSGGVCDCAMAAEGFHKPGCPKA